jgi:hypothetical protein
METFILVTWPESQFLMEEEWFEECILMNDENHYDEYGSSAYFVPASRYKELMVNSD